MTSKAPNAAAPEWHKRAGLSPQRSKSALRLRKVEEPN